jgi:hypothetical protein
MIGSISSALRRTSAAASSSASSAARKGKSEGSICEAATSTPFNYMIKLEN